MASLDEQGVEWLIARIAKSLGIDVVRVDRGVRLSQGKWSCDIAIPSPGIYDAESRTIDFSSETEGAGHE